MLDTLRTKLGDKIVADSKVDKAQYKALVGQASIVISASLHEFQGLAMLEAVSAGAVPLAPNQLCYPEQYADEYLYPAGDVEALVSRLTQWLTVELPSPVDVSSWSEAVLKPQWTAVLDS